MGGEQQLAGQAGRELFDTLLVFENYPVDQALRGQDDGLRFSNLQVSEQTHYPLSLAIMAGDDLQVHWHYQRAHFSNVQIQRLSAQFRHVLQAICAQDNQPGWEASATRDALLRLGGGSDIKMSSIPFRLAGFLLI